MKYYPISESELSQMFATCLAAIICFSVAAGFAGFAIVLEAFGDVVASWNAARTFAWSLSIAFFVVGCVFLYGGHAIIRRIKESTRFPEDGDLCQDVTRVNREGANG